MKIEYMIYKDKKESFANDVGSIKNLILIDSDIKKENEVFSYDELVFEVDINTISSLDNKNNYFDFTITYSGRVSDKAANKLTSLHRKIISIFKGNFTSAPKILWSDLDSYYSTKAYPLIKDVENLMRKVLTKLLIVKVGYSWEKSSVSSDLKGKAGSSKGRNIESNYLSALDFIDLTQIIFDKYSSTHRDVIFSELEKACKKGDLSLVADILPRSNWQKYLSEFFKCKEDVLIEKWSQLYDIRCAIAHNTGFTKGDFDNCVELTKFITQTLNDSLKNINNSSIDVSNADVSSDNAENSEREKNEGLNSKSENYDDLKSLQVSIESMSNPESRDLSLIKNTQLHESLGKLNIPGLVSTNPALQAIMSASSSPVMGILNKNSELIKTLTATTDYYDSLMKNISRSDYLDSIMKAVSQASYYDSLMKNIPTINTYEKIMDNISSKKNSDQIEINHNNQSNEPTNGDD